MTDQFQRNDWTLPLAQNPMNLMKRRLQTHSQRNPALIASTGRTVRCLHCHQGILDDGQFAGQVVCCPHCQGKIVMPQHHSDLSRINVSYPVIDNAARSMTLVRLAPYSEYTCLSIDAKRNVFSVPGLEDIETIQQVKRIVDECIEMGQDFDEFARKMEMSFKPALAFSQRSLEKVFRSTLNKSYLAELVTTLELPVVNSGFPYLLFSAVHDDRTPATHLALERFGLDGTAIYRTDDPFWCKFMPPLSDLCRCTVIPLSITQAADKGAKEAQAWLQTNQPPRQPQWVNAPAHDPRLDLEDEWWPESLETPQEILIEIVATRASLIKTMENTQRCGQPGRRPRGVPAPTTQQHALALLQGSIQADFTLPNLACFFEAMRRASMKNVPGWRGESENEAKCLETIDAVIACCRLAASQA
jgi:hypothetical protein